MRVLFGMLTGRNSYGGRTSPDELFLFQTSTLDGFDYDTW